MIYSDGSGWHRPRFFETTAGGMGQAAKQLLNRYWGSFSQSDKVRAVEVRLTLTKGYPAAKADDAPDDDDPETNGDPGGE